MFWIYIITILLIGCIILLTYFVTNYYRMCKLLKKHQQEWDNIKENLSSQFNGDPFSYRECIDEAYLHYIESISEFFPRR